MRRGRRRRRAGSPYRHSRFAEILVSIPPVDFRTARGVWAARLSMPTSDSRMALLAATAPPTLLGAHRTGTSAHWDIDSKPHDHTCVIGGLRGCVVRSASLPVVSPPPELHECWRGSIGRRV